MDPMPKLSAAIVADESALVLTLDAFLRSDPTYRRRSKAILRRQSELRDLLGPQAWAIFLQLEETTNERCTAAMLRLVTWAFDAGRRAR